jgi:hypothetical protein
MGTDEVRNPRQSQAIGQHWRPEASQLPITDFAHKAAIERDAHHSAVGALLDMAAKRRRAARFDRGHHLALPSREDSFMLGAEGVAVVAEDVRHLQRGPHGALQRGGGSTAG